MLNMIKMLSQFSIFEGVSTHVRSKVAKATKTVRLSPGQIYQLDRVDQAVFLVEKGSVYLVNAHQKKLQLTHSIVGFEALCNMAVQLSKSEWDVTDSVHAGPPAFLVGAAGGCELFSLSIDALHVGAEMSERLKSNIRMVAANYVRKLAAKGNLKARKCFEKILLEIPSSLNEDIRRQEEVLNQQRIDAQRRVEAMKRQILSANIEWAAMRASSSGSSEGDVLSPIRGTLTSMTILDPFHL
ncbi:hypothetical protein GUITHDRAFT_112812 [Guillardia theta CCMP2712]|uniref:Cyclic nucleotide-binding domain-containing protein n=1 Tax=Guillardia theta (strain CCMP2712) TaxID=905079 RepID=L1IYV0_GUITC|nr:hypothetical protein GUITHDRAFT_112812 [Guillardia theta CCMP2712]EKX41079.1 hypothetical protein GUITHDRAFT_112812 [Guillardia theta CCMP2712]|eukprot:XP_005828059.1 hypothetical protein GUITHDRAFT_112812 [Guillardia theta CCMP2712]